MLCEVWLEADSAQNALFNQMLSGDFSGIPEIDKLADVAFARRQREKAEAAKQRQGQSAQNARKARAEEETIAEEIHSSRNGERFVDLEQGESFKRLESVMLERIAEEAENRALGLKAKIGSKSNAKHLVHKESSSGSENHDAHKYAVKNVLELFRIATAGIVHHDKKGTKNDYVRVFAPFKFGDGIFVATITLRRSAGVDSIYSIEAVDVEENAGDSPRSSQRTAQEAQSPDSLSAKITYYVGDVNATKPRMLGIDGDFSVSAIAAKIRKEASRIKGKSTAGNMKSDGMLLEAKDGDGNSAVSLIALDPDAPLESAKNEYFVQYFIRALNDTSLLTADETSVSVDGWRRIRGAMLGAILGAGGEMDSTIRAIAEDANLKMSAVLTGIKDEAHHILKLRSLEGKEMYDIAPDIADALREYVEFRRTGGKSLEPYLAQQDFFTGRPTLTEAIMREFFASGQKPSVIAKTLNTYVKLAMLQDNESPALFEMEVTPRERLWELAVKNAHAELETEAEAKIEMDAAAEGKRNMVTAEEDARHRDDGLDVLNSADSFDEIEANLRTRIGERVVNNHFGISAKIGSNRNANELAQHTSIGENVQAHKLAAKNVLELFRRSKTGILHHDRKGSSKDYIRAFSPFYFANETYFATITLRRDADSDKLYSIEAVATEKGANFGVSRGNAAPLQNYAPENIEAKITHYVGDVNKTKPRFIDSDDAFSIPRLAERIRADIADFAERGQTREAHPPLVIADGNKFTDGLNAKQKKGTTPQISGEDASNAVAGTGHDVDGRRFSVSRNTRATIDGWLDKRKDLDANERNAFWHYIEDSEPMVQLATGKWFANGAIRLPEDQLTVDEAIKNAKKMKADPMQYDAPGLINTEYRKRFGDDKVKPLGRKLLSPDDGRFKGILTDKKDVGNGITVYTVQDNAAGQRAVRELMNDHLGKDFNCWCLLYANSNGEITDGASADNPDGYWNDYNSVPKRVAFKDGEIIAFCASSNGYNEWWDLSDRSYDNAIPVEMKIPGDKYGRSAIGDYNEETGEFSVAEGQEIFRGNKKNGMYEEWHGLDPHSVAYQGKFKGGAEEGLHREWYENGQLRSEINYKNGEPVGRFREWYDNGQIRIDRTHDKNGERDGLCRMWYKDGQLEYEGEFKNGEVVGMARGFNDKGDIIKEERNIKDVKVGEWVERHFDYNGTFLRGSV